MCLSYRPNLTIKNPRSKPPSDLARNTWVALSWGCARQRGVRGAVIPIGHRRAGAVGGGAGRKLDATSCPPRRLSYIVCRVLPSAYDLPPNLMHVDLSFFESNSII